MTDGFRPPWWLRSRHLQTLWPTLTRRLRRPAFERQRLELADGDFLDLDWLAPSQRVDSRVVTDEGGPVVLILHGLGGSSDSTYASGLAAALATRGMTSVVSHFRGCSGEPNRLDRSYHSGDTADLQLAVEAVRARCPDRPLGAVGFSLGGNVLLKWLGEHGEQAPVRAAVAVSVPFQLNEAADALNSGFARVYQWYLIRTLVNGLRRKFVRRPPPSCIDATLGAGADFWTFDDRVTAPLHGFRDVHHYYGECSSRQYLGKIGVPTLLVQAKDDPFLPERAIPRPDELSASTSLEVSEGGGHVGFVGGRWPWATRYYLEQRVPDFLQAQLIRRCLWPSC